MSAEFSAYWVFQDGGLVLLVGPSGAQVRRLDTGAVVSTKPGVDSEYLCGDISGGVVYLGQALTRGVHPTINGVTIADAANIASPRASFVTPAVPRAIAATKAGAWAGYNDGTRGKLRFYSRDGAEGVTIDLGPLVADVAEVPGGIAVLTLDGAARVVDAVSGKTIERYNFGAQTGHNARIAGSETHLAASAFADGARAVRRNSDAPPILTRMGLSAQTIGIVADVVMASCPAVSSRLLPNRLERYDLATGKVMSHLPTPSFARDIEPIGGVAFLLADPSQGYTQHGTAPQPEPAPNPNPTPQPVDKGMVGTLQVTLGPAQPDGRRAVVSATGSFNPVA